MNTSSTSPSAVYLKDYLVPDFLVENVDLRFDLHEEHTDVTARVKFQRNPKSTRQDAPLTLDGEKLELRALLVNDRPLVAGEYEVTSTLLTIPNMPASFTLETHTRIKPQENLTLEGLYKSDGMFCTQCEAQGFRKITYYPDRPDVMSIFTTTIIADKKKYPVLLSNGNRVETGDLPDGRHQAKWQDPFKKPAYLFALVAGDLAKIEDHFTTKSGRKVKLEIYTDHGNENRLDHGMASLKKAMHWDEEVFGLEYDLDMFMIVAVNDFNFGAMENKGLNIFNSRLILANPTTATDADYDAIEGVVGHEYFHNWTGNRVTCRDWFQLSLKEGLTVYRDQEFSADVTSRPVKRIDDVSALRARQFPEDAGPMAHPIRPTSYIEINNFYTTTVYEKGAEVIRMIEKLLGREGFRKGIDKYFELFDGQAVTTDDFVHAMELANGVELKQFRETWYAQAGTPRLNVKSSYDAGSKTYTLEVMQSCPPTPGQPTKKAYHLPLAIGLLDRSGREIAAKVLEIRKEKETFQFPNIAAEPVPSLLRGFSAPVNLDYDYSDADLLFLLAHDTDSFARWEAGQKLALRTVERLIGSAKRKETLHVDEGFLKTMGAIVVDRRIDPAFRARLLDVPSETYIGQMQQTIDVDAIHEARDFLIREIARYNESVLVEAYRSMAHEGPYRYEPSDTGRRALRSACLSFLTALDKPEHIELAFRQVHAGVNMTEEMAGLLAIKDSGLPLRDQAFQHFYNKWKHDTLVINKWLAAEAMSQTPGGLERVKRLMKDPVFNINNPNKVASVLGAFGRENLAQFHAIDGSAYRFFADQILDIDTRNPNLSARLAGLFNQWRRFDPTRQSLMREQIERIAKHPGLSAGVYEIASKALA